MFTLKNSEEESMKGGEEEEEEDDDDDFQTDEEEEMEMDTQAVQKRKKARRTDLCNNIFVWK